MRINVISLEFLITNRNAVRLIAKERKFILIVLSKSRIFFYYTLRHAILVGTLTSIKYIRKYSSCTDVCPNLESVDW